MSLEITGRLLVTGTTVVVSEKFKKREFILEITEEINGNSYTNYGKFQLTQSKCDILDSYRPGEEVVVKFNVKGNKYEKDGKTNYITNLDAWRIERTSNQPAQAYNQPPPVQQYASQPQQQYNQPTPNFSAPPIDDLPF